MPFQNQLCNFHIPPSSACRQTIALPANKKSGGFIFVPTTEEEPLIKEITIHHSDSLKA
ncbi:hypothetical protein DSO57_1032755 [Entomophthora muscae]|uniref:Uncharacterized protein n=1 Tax=Entomophthora muscae TaxID=34485 RepID=A0ACC2SPK1_9FUNG|nr:hypothetical protein DSO57_1032755 [Entomophthora muscae]